MSHVAVRFWLMVKSPLGLCRSNSPMSLQLAVNFFGSSWSGQIVYVYGNLAIVLLLKFGFNGNLQDWL
jgi:hypothetical protein